MHSVNHPHNVKMFSVSNHTISLSVGHPFFKTHFATSGQGVTGANVKQQLLGGIPVALPHLVLPAIDSINGITESW